MMTEFSLQRVTICLVYCHAWNFEFVQRTVVVGATQRQYFREKGEAMEFSL